ncbi:hypothetical protein [Virgibacillus sp. YIM 98842]|uniref:FIMAH domain-containing protein n=1 Tax=Virgibacillus sp. YIM 98842 TaxID=2663533 RepID=UPI0013DA8498|nr:hypothetical protein [Virgibacillus sp. YIM 98842]
MSKLMNRITIISIAILLLSGMFLQMPAEQIQANNQEVETELIDFVPSWVKEGGRSEMLKRMVDPELRLQIREEIDEIVNERVESPSDIRFPELGDTLEDWMGDFDRETNFEYDIEQGQALWSFVNLDYNNGNTVHVDEFTVEDLDEETIAFSYDFTGEDGDSWDPEAFGDDLFVYPRNPDAVRYSIENNTGKMEVEERRNGTASSYGKLTPIMEDLDNSEVRMRFRVDELGSTQWLRVWVQSDQFGSGSSFARNGYGIALHLGNDELALQRREDSSTTKLEGVPANMTTDWHWLKLRASEGKVAVSLWNDNEEEPEEWDIEYDIPEVQKKSMLSFANLDADEESVFYIDDISIESPENESIFEYDFSGDDGADWDMDAFDQLYSFPASDNPDGVKYSIQDNTGKVELGKQQNDLSASYGKVIPMMKNPMDSSMLMRFRTDGAENNQWMRAFIRADEFLDGNSSPKNGYGMELNFNTNQLKLFGMENKNTFHLDSINVNMTTDWHWLRLHINEDELAVRLWEDGKNEPGEWDLVQEISENVSAGESIIRLLHLRGNLDTIYTPSDDPDDPDPIEYTIDLMKTQVEEFLDVGEINSDEAARHLLTHLTAIEQYEGIGSMDKAVKHMESFKSLLEHQKENELISPTVYDELKAGADDLIEQWE